MIAATTARTGGAVPSHAGARFCCEAIEELGLPPGRRRPEVLVAGCGAGHEAAYLQQRLAANVYAVDLELAVDDDCLNRPRLLFQQASVLELPFEDGRFDLVFYHHVIEHVADPAGSLAEISRVMRTGGWMFLGTPNRHRLVSSAGAYRQTDWRNTLWAKLRDNLHDWSDRLALRFRNEKGAHAGFSRRELDRLLAPHFLDRRWLTREYLRFKYRGCRLARFLPLPTSRALLWCAAPSLYVLCRR